MTATFHQPDGTWKRVYVRLTPEERYRYFRAHALSFILFWKTPAEIMGSELESIVCGHRPERYVDFDWSGRWQEKGEK